MAANTPEWQQWVRGKQEEARAGGGIAAPPTARAGLGEAAGLLQGAPDIMQGLRQGMAESYGARGGRMGTQAQQAALGMGLTPLESVGAGQEALLDVNRQYYSQLPQMEMGFLQALAPLWQSYSESMAGLPTPEEERLRSQQAQQSYYDLLFGGLEQQKAGAQGRVSRMLGGAPGATPTGQQGATRATGQGAGTLPGFQEMGGDTQGYMQMLQTIGQNPDMIRGLAALTGRSLQTTPQPSTQGRGIQPAQYQPAAYQSPLGRGGQPATSPWGTQPTPQISMEETLALATAAGV